MNIEKIVRDGETIKIIKLLHTHARLWSRNCDECGVRIFAGNYNPNEAISKELEPIVHEINAFAKKRLEAFKSLRIAELEAEIRGEIAPEPDADAWLDPVRTVFGQHCGLNADWSCMAWKISGDLDCGVYLLDQEFDGTMAIVSRKQTEDDAVMVTIAEGNISVLLPIALSLRQG